jgi:tetratricopeptide (TPR) repeat protein
MRLFDGLYLYEVVMLVLGAVVVLVALGLIIGKGPRRGLAVLIVGVIMIGWPSIRSVQYKDGVITIEKTTRDLERDPTNAAARDSLSKAIAQVAARPSQDPRVFTTLARAQLALGDRQAADASIRKALQADPHWAEALELQKRIGLVRSLDSLTSQVEQHPRDAAAKGELAKVVGEVTQYPIASPSTLTSLARAQATIGDRARALSTVDKALAIDSSLAPAKELRGRIKTTEDPP